MQVYEGDHVEIHISLTLVLVAGEWSVSRPDRFTPGERAPSTHSTGGWVGPRAGLDNMQNRIFLTLLGLNPSVVQPIASRYTDCASLAPKNITVEPLFKKI
jgi:hypothetical protein